VQLAFDVFGPEERQILAKQVEGFVQTFMESEHGNFVLQKIMAVFTPQKASFVARELQDVIGHAARHQFGCRIFQRLMEHPESEACAALIENILKLSVLELSGHKYGCHVVAAILEHGTADQKKQVVATVNDHLDTVIENRHALSVLVNVLDLYGDHQFSKHICRTLFSEPHRIATITTSKNGKKLIAAAAASRVLDEDEKVYMRKQMVQAQECVKIMTRVSAKHEKFAKQSFQVAELSIAFAGN